MSNLNNDDDKHVILNLVQDPIGSLANPVVLSIREFLEIQRGRVLQISILDNGDNNTYLSELFSP
jgi:hypothetical protein